MEMIYKYLAILVVILALMGGSYAFGHSQGFSSGETKGRNDQQLVINKLTDQINAEHTQQNNKVTAVEQTAATDASVIDKVESTKETQKAQIITKYITVHDQQPKNPAQPQTCGGLTLGAVQAVNQLLDIDAASTGLSSIMWDTPQQLAEYNP